MKEKCTGFYVAPYIVYSSTHTHYHVIYRYLYGVIENQGIKLCQVLDMVALNYMVVLFHQTS